MTKRSLSLRARLTVLVVAVLFFSLLGFSIAIEVMVRSSLWSQFDERLVADAKAIANNVEERDEGPWEIETGALDDFQRPTDEQVFEVTMDDGSVLARSTSLGTSTWRESASTAVSPRTTELPNGDRGRLVSLLLKPRYDQEFASRASGRLLRVTIASPTREVDVALFSLRLLLLLSGFATLAGAAIVSVTVVRRGLRPLLNLSQDIAALDASKLLSPISQPGLPAELEPVVSKLNELLGRLENSMSRERRFSADVSHELRTPLAGIRSILEVTASRDRSSAEFREAIQQVLAVVEQMTTLVETLLTLARLDAKQFTTERKDVRLRPVVDELLRALAGDAQARSLRCENLVSDEVSMSTDVSALRLLLGNLLRNAVQYTEKGGTIAINSDLSRGICVEVVDSGPAIPTDAINRIFERFYRVETSRTDSGQHHGLGLSLVRSLAEALDLAVTAENRHDGKVAFTVTRAGK